MYLFTLIVGVVLFPQAHTLTCYQCVSGTGSCPQMQCLYDTNQCAALRVIAYAGSSKILDLTTKSCLPPEQCIEGSINYGVSKEFVTSKCCSSNLCNDIAPDPPITKPNGKKCYGCNGLSDCTGTVNCEGNEDQCIKATVTSGGQTATAKGCATKSMCLATSKPYVPGLRNTEVHCCEGNYCNGADGAGASILLLLTTMLISTCFFSN